MRQSRRWTQVSGSERGGGGLVQAQRLQRGGGAADQLEHGDHEGPAQALIVYLQEIRTLSSLQDELKNVELAVLLSAVVPE